MGSQLKYHLVFLSIWTLFGCSLVDGQPQRILAKNFKEKLDSIPQKQIIDVRTPQEFAGEHIPGAININFNDRTFRESIKKLPRNIPVFVYCLSGGRSGQALKIFTQEKFTTVYELRGGIMDWKKEHYPTEKSKRE